MKQPSTHYGADRFGHRLVIMRSTRGRKPTRPKLVLDADLRSLTAAEQDTLSTIQAEVLARDAGLSSSLPTGSCFARWLQTPFASESKAARVQHSLLDIQLPFPLEECIALFPRRGRNEANQVKCLAVVAKSSTVESALHQWQELGIDPTCLQHEALACWAQACVEVPFASDSTRVLFHIAEDRASLVIGQATDPQAIHAFRTGTSAILQPDGSLDEANLQHMTNRLQQVLRSHLPGTHRSVQWVISGSGAPQEALRAQLLQRVDEFDTNPVIIDSPDLFLARALACQGLAAPPNFRVETLTHPVAQMQSIAQAKRVMVGLVASGLLLCALNLGWIGYLKDRNQSAQDKVQLEAKSLSGLTYIPPGQEVFTVQQALGDLTTVQPPGLQVLGPSLTPILRDLLHAAVTAGANLADVSIRSQEFTATGTLAEGANVEAIQRAMEEQGYVVTVTTRDGENASVFTLNGGPGS